MSSPNESKGADEYLFPVEADAEKIKNLRTIISTLCKDGKRDTTDEENLVKDLYALFIFSDGKSYFRPSHRLVTSTIIKHVLDKNGKKVSEDAIGENFEEMEERLSKAGTLIATLLNGQVQGDSEIANRIKEIFGESIPTVHLKRLQKSTHSLCNIISGEGVRYSMVYANYGKTEEEILKKHAALNQEVNKARESIDAAKNIRSEIIAILGIFAAIVLAFSGSLSILGNAVSALQHISFFDAMLLGVICIFGLFNVIFILLFVVAKLCNKSVAIHCRHGVCSGCGKWCWAPIRFERKFPYVFWIDLFLILAIVGLFIARILFKL